MLRYIGRRKIYTDVAEITRENILPVLSRAYSVHRINMADMQYLISYEAGLQPLPFVKTIRPDIDIRTVDNMANYVTEFHKGYFWGTPTIYTQRGNNELHGTDAETDSEGIAGLNEMMLNAVCIGREDQRLADFVEKVGIGHRIVLPRSDWDDESLTGTYAHAYTLDSRFAFCVYFNSVGHRKALGVTFAKESGKNHFTCFTDRHQYDIIGDRVTESINPLGMIPIVEYERAVDRTGCFERQISLMDNLNSMVSNFANDVAQKTQDVWWGNDIEFPVDEKTGEYIKPKSGQWVLTFTGDGNNRNPKIQPLSSTFDSDPTLNAISNTRNEILKQCFVPMQYSSEGGGSTGVASSISSGWDSTAVDADRKEQLISGAKREELILLLKAISLAPSGVLPSDSPLRQIHSSDIDIKFTRRQNWDLSTKANAYATLVSHGIHGRHAMKVIGLFDDIEQAYIDSKDGIELFQSHTYGNEDEKIMQDTSDQRSQSPFIDGLRAGQGSEA